VTFAIEPHLRGIEAYGRDRILRQADLVDHALVCSTIDRQLPALLLDVEGLLAERT